MFSNWPNSRQGHRVQEASGRGDGLSLRGPWIPPSILNVLPASLVSCVTPWPSLSWGPLSLSWRGARPHRPCTRAAQELQVAMSVSSLPPGQTGAGHLGPAPGRCSGCPSGRWYLGRATACRLKPGLSSRGCGMEGQAWLTLSKGSAPPLWALTGHQAGQQGRRMKWVPCLGLVAPDGEKGGRCTGAGLEVMPRQPT